MKVSRTYLKSLGKRLRESNVKHYTLSEYLCLVTNGQNVRVLLIFVILTSKFVTVIKVNITNHFVIVSEQYCFYHSSVKDQADYAKMWLKCGQAV